MSYHDKTYSPIIVLALLTGESGNEIKYKAIISDSVVEYTNEELLKKTVADIVLLAKNGVEYTIIMKNDET